MKSLTSEADRNWVVGFTWLRNVPVFRSKTAIPAVTPAGTTTGDGDGAGALEAGADASVLAAELGCCATVAGTFPPHPPSAASAASIRSAPRIRMGHFSVRCRR